MIVAGASLLHYRLIEKIGGGGMGMVFEATDTRLDRHVAVKVLPPELTQDPERRARFQQEARLAAAFNHPNIATVHDVGEQDGVTFIVMELLRGETLRSLVHASPLEIDRAIDIATGIAAGLARAHREGVLHRDLKPDNVALTDEGVPKILDFGLSKLIADAEPSDESSLDTATAILRDDPAPLDALRRDVPAELKSILARSLAKEPAERFASGQELHVALLALKRRQETPAAGFGTLLRRPAFIAVAELVIVVIGAGLTWFVKRNSRESWARNAALPEIERLYDSGDRDGAMRLLYEAAAIIPDDPQFLRYVNSIAIPMSLDSDPPGATVYTKGYNHPEREWIRLGETPIENKPIGRIGRIKQVFARRVK